MYLYEKASQIQRQKAPDPRHPLPAASRRQSPAEKPFSKNYGWKDTSKSFDKKRFDKKSFNRKSTADRSHICPLLLHRPGGCPDRGTSPFCQSGCGIPPQLSGRRGRRRHHRFCRRQLGPEFPDRGAGPHWKRNRRLPQTIQCLLCPEYAG